MSFVCSNLQRTLYSALLLVITIVCLFPHLAHAGETDRLRGFAWSPNIGWISFNCLNTDYCDTIDYGVNARGNNTIQALSGWAWSPGGTDSNNDYQPGLGWINFDNATLNTVTGELGGTALVYNTTVAPYRSGDSEDDGWDGIIDLSGTAGPVSWGPAWDTADDTADGWDWRDDLYNLFDGFAWGDLNVGWVSFSCQAAAGKANTCGTVQYGVQIEPFYMDLDASKGKTQIDAVVYNTPFNHIWTLEPTAAVSSCTGSNGPGDWSNTPNKPYSPSPVTQTVYNSVASATSTLACSTGGVPNKTVTRNLPIFVAPPPPVALLTADDTNVPYNTATTLRMDSSEVSSCILDGGIFTNQSIPTNTLHAESTGLLTDFSRTYIFDCESVSPINYPSGAQSAVTVYVERLIMDFYAVDEDSNRLNQNELVSYTARGDINLQWDLEFATNGCTASSTPATPQWADSATSTDGTHSQTIFGIDPGNFEFSLTCNGTNGQTDTQTVSLTIGKNPTPSEKISDFLNQNN